MDLKKMLKEHKVFILLLFIFLVIQLILSIPFQTIVWDEAVYAGMGKYIYSGGTSGIFEEIRPVGLPFILGLFIAAGLSEVVTAKFVAFLFAAAYLCCTYLIGIKLFDKSVGLIAVGLLLITPIFETTAYFSLTSIASAVFAMLALYVLVEKQWPFVAGILASCAFMVRFTSGLILPTLYLVILLFAVARKKELFTGSSVKKLFKDGLLVTAGFLTLVIPFLIGNYIAYRQYTSNAFDAIFRPFILAIWHQGNPAAGIAGGKLYQLTFYLTQNILENVFFIFLFVGLYYLYKYHDLKKWSIALAIVLPLLYYTLISNKQLRFSLFFLSFIALISAYGIIELYRVIKKKQLTRSIRSVGVVILLLVCIVSFSSGMKWIERGFTIEFPPEQTFPDDLQSLFEKHSITGSVITSHPVPSIYLDNKFIGETQFPIVLFDTFASDDEIQAIIYSPEIYWCREGDADCENTIASVSQALMKNYNFIYYDMYNGNNYYIFSKDDDIPSFNGEYPHLVEGIQDNEQVHVVIRIDDAAGIYREDKKNGIWNEKGFFRITDLLVNKAVPHTWAVIPRDLQEMNLGNRTYLTDYYETNKDYIEIAQRGFIHDDLSIRGSSEEVQTKWITFERDILQSLLNTTVTTFVPPFNQIDDTTVTVLTKEGFQVYSSVAGDLVDTRDLARFDQSITLIDSWIENTPQIKSFDQLRDEFAIVSQYTDVVVLTFPTHAFSEESDFEGFEDFIDHLQNLNVSFVSISEARNVI